MYLQDTPMDTMAKDLMFQKLCSTSTWNSRGLMPNTSNSYIFMCFRASCSTQMFHNSCAPQLLAQHKHQILMCSRAPRSTKNISSIKCFTVHAQQMKSYIKHMHLDYTQYIKQIIILMCRGVLCPVYKIKHQSNITCNGTYAHKCQVKILRYYMFHANEHHDGNVVYD